jgi:hypothetical protein
MKYGLHFENANKQMDWMRESDKTISIWESESEADSWRRNHTVFPNKYTVKRVTPKIIENDKEQFLT